MNRTLVITLFVCTLICACSTVDVRHSLLDVESYIQERPDSALSVLDTMDRGLLSTRSLRAHHALLHAMALDKNYIDVSDDSLAVIAVDYYSKRGPRRKYARALYYNGLTCYYRGEYENAIVEFTKAAKVAENSDSLYLGMIHLVKADTYAGTYNSIEELNSLLQAYDIFDELSEDYYLNVTKYRMGIAYSNLGDYESADDMFDSIDDMAVTSDAMHAAISTSHAYVKVISDYPDLVGALAIYDDICSDGLSGYLTYRDYWSWAFALAGSGDTDAADQIVSAISFADTSSTAQYWMYRIAEAKGDTEMALTSLEKATDMNFDEVETALMQSLASAQRDYYDAQSQVFAYESKVKSISIGLLCTISVLASVILYMVAVAKIRKERKTKENLLEYIEEINRLFNVCDRGHDESLKSKFITLYKSRFEILNKLCDHYLQFEGYAGAENMMYRKIWSMVEDIRNDKVRQGKFEVMLDTELNGIMSNVRNEMPKFKENDFTLFSYLVAGFDSTTISRLMNMSLNNVYAHKRRLRIRIEEKQPLHATQFLEMIQ